MKPHTIIVTTLCVLMFGEGCKTLQPSTQRTTSAVTTDSSHVEYIDRYVPVYLPGDSIAFTQYIDCPDTINTTPTPFSAAIQGKRSSGKLVLDSRGKLTATFNCDAWADSVKVRDTEINRLRTSALTDSTTVTVHVKFIPKAYKYSMWFSCAILALILAWLVWQAVKLYLKLKPF